MHMDNSRRRALVLTDISTLDASHGEPDDTQSMVRLFLYANELDVEGLIATYTSHSGRAHPEYLHAMVDAYAGAAEALRERDARYPLPETLDALVKCGSYCCGLDHVGPGKDTEGSEWIIRAADRDDDRPLWILIWGGPLDLAQALWKVSATRTEEKAAAFRQRLRVYAIADQYDETGPWIRAQYPDLFYIKSGVTFRGMYRCGDASTTTPEWVREHIVYGPLGSRYPVYDGGDPWGRVQGLKEGDSPSLLYLVDPQGDPEHPEGEHWGGQFVKKGNHYFDLPDEEAAKASVARWRQDYQEDFRRRMTWTIRNYHEKDGIER